MIRIKFCFYVLMIVYTIGSECRLNAKILDRSFYNKAVADIPRILDKYDMDLYYNMYLYAITGQGKQVKKLVTKLHNKVLVPYIYYHMYSLPTYSASYQELKQWLVKYQDTSVARFVKEEIYSKYPQKAKEIEKIATSSFYDYFTPIYLRHDYFLNINSNSTLLNGAVSDMQVVENKYTRQFLQYIKKGYHAEAEKLMLHNKLKSSVSKYSYAYYANVLAKAFFLSGKDTLALKWGKIAVQHFKTKIPEASFTLGLVYYRLGDYRSAITYFHYLGDNNFSTIMTAKGLYWEAKVSLLLGDIDNYYNKLKIASQYIYNFYGLLAREELGITNHYIASNLDLDGGELNVLVLYPEGRRALSLLQFGFKEWAEQELISLASSKMIGAIKDVAREKRILEVLLYMAKNASMSALALKLAGLNGRDYGLVDFAYPVDMINLPNGYEVDPALILAIIKKESEFYTRAKSAAGAVGLMQVLPATAKSIIEKYNLNYKAHEYYIPQINIDLGQKYLSMLINNFQSGGNLLYVIASYNAGFGNVDKWRKNHFRMANDPVFFIESIPFRETRHYVKEVLTNYWIYQSLMGREAYTLNLLAQDDQPYYYEVDKETIANIVTNHRNT